MIYWLEKIHSPGALARRGGAPFTELATSRPWAGLWSFF